jgi:exocyst complex protein 7
VFDQYPQTEYGNLSDLAPLTGQAQISQSFTQLLTPVLALFSSALSSLTALIKRSLHTHAFLALSTLNVLSSATGRWDAAIGLSQIGSNGKKDELRDASTAIRALCLRSFPEFLADVKTAALPRGEVGTGLAEITQQVGVFLSSSNQVIILIAILPHIKGRHLS